MTVSASPPGGATGWEKYLDDVAALPGHGRLRALCAEDYRNHLGELDPLARDGYRALVVRLATGEPEGDPSPGDASLRAYVARHGCGGC